MNEQLRFATSHSVGGGGGGGGRGGGGAAAAAAAAPPPGPPSDGVGAEASTKRAKTDLPLCHGGYSGCDIASHHFSSVRISVQQRAAFASFHENNPGHEL